MDNAKDLTPYERLGGAPAIKRMVDILYGHITMDDKLYLRLFQNVDLARLKHHMVALLSQILGGPKQYDGRALSEAHAGLGITDDEYDRVGSYVMSGLWALVPPADIVAAVSDVLENNRSVIVGRSDP